MIKENIIRLRSLIPQYVTIVAVSKGRSVEEIKEAIEAGIADIGENKVQEALLKYNELITHNSELLTLKWHMVGHLQTNKVRDAVKIFDLIQSVDSIRLAREIDKEAAKINKVQDILIEVKTSEEATKFGMPAEQVAEAIKEIGKLKNINIQGLMTIAPLVSEAEESRPYFRQLKELRNKIISLGFRISDLEFVSMGMTDDYKVAIEEGSNMVRIGRAIFS